MVVVLIIVGLIGVIYFTGDVQRKQKMRKIGGQIADVTKDTVDDSVNLTKKFVYKIRKNKTCRNTGKWK